MSQSAISTSSHTALNSSTVNASLALAGRIMIAAIFLLSGFSKITAPAMMIGYIQSVGLPLPAVALGLAILVEVGGSIALILGYRTKLIAAIMALFTVVTAIAFHNNLADQNQFIHFFKNIAMAGGLLQVIALGAGRFSLDARRG
ncbi:DoxX family protein [Pseudomonas sp.]|uniref:DoxX family protein n=1 Tax=Pseudomonas sp. TaxID=306 RepID=UPI00262A8CBB|nr:DoxX family protein [Pseudomonas sp.]